MIRVTGFIINLSVNLTTVYNYCYEDLLQSKMDELGVDEENWFAIGTSSSYSVYYSTSLVYTQYGSDTTKKHYVKFTYGSGTVNNVAAYISFVFINRNKIYHSS